MIRRTQRTSLAAKGVVALAVVLLFQGPLSGCGDCDDSGVEPTYVIRVRDATTGGSICDATVLINGSGGVGPNGMCTYSAPIPYVQSSSATIRVEHPAYQSAEKQVPTKWPSDSCGKALPVNVEFALVKL